MDAMKSTGSTGTPGLVEGFAGHAGKSLRMDGYVGLNTCFSLSIYNMYVCMYVCMYVGR